MKDVIEKTDFQSIPRKTDSSLEERFYFSLPFFLHSSNTLKVKEFCSIRHQSGKKKKTKYAYQHLPQCCCLCMHETQEAINHRAQRSGYHKLFQTSLVLHHQLQYGSAEREVGIRKQKTLRSLASHCQR